MTENVRLVVWDLDDTFWRGTLTEGGYTYQKDVHDIVIELNRRGIMNSICSKNDFNQVKAILSGEGIWEYFVFASIDWRPKGLRLQEIIENVQLRPETVLFIDDHPMNLAEARHYVPGIQTESDAFVPNILNDPRFRGKDDSQFTRLQQYKTLELKHLDKEKSTGGNSEFLRSSEVRIKIDYDVENKIDRAIELINRTNQLNYTKVRLSEDIENARNALRQLIRRYDVFSGLVEISDKYGAYGIVGFFAKIGQANLVHFCFSCRTLNMGVESWVYQWLGRPKFVQVGEVLTDIVNETQPVDWITWIHSVDEKDELGSEVVVDRIVVRGGCDMSAVSHYLGDLCTNMALELNTARDGRGLRIDHSSFIKLIFNPPSDVERKSLESIGYHPSDWLSALATPVGDGARDVWILSFFTDSFCKVYQHRELPIRVPFTLPQNPHAIYDLTTYSEEQLADLNTTAEHRSTFRFLKRDYRCLDVDLMPFFRQAIELLINSATTSTLICFVLGPESWTDSKSGKTHARPQEMKINLAIRDAASEFVNSKFVCMDELDGGVARDEPLHFDRMVYANLASHLRQTITSFFKAQS